MGGRWDSRDPWDDAYQDDAGDEDAWEEEWPSNRSGQSGSRQPRPYQPHSSQARAFEPHQSQARPYQSNQAPYESQQYYQPGQSQARSYQGYQGYQGYQAPYQEQQQYAPYASANRAAVSARVQIRSQPKRRSATAIAGGALSLIAAVALVGLLAHSQILALLHRSTPTNASALVLPAFSDWRVTYAGQDGLLHAVTLDGQTDVTGMSLAALAASATPAGGASAPLGAAVSPDGHYLIYTGNAGPILLHLNARQSDPSASRSGATVPDSVLWSPDSAQLAWLASNGAVHLTNVATLADTATSGTATLGIAELLGWVDATHLAVRVAKANATSEQVAVLDTASGQLRVVVTLNKSGRGTLHYRLSPDGARLLAYNSPITGQPFTAIFRNYDMQSGQVHLLPNALHAVGTNVADVAWKPGAATVAIGSGSEAGHNLKLWLVDTTADSATSIGATYPLGWLADGSALLTGNADTATLGGGPYTISAFTFPATGAPIAATLTDKAMSFPWLGLARTA